MGKSKGWTFLLNHVLEQVMVGIWEKLFLIKNLMLTLEGNGSI